MRRKLRWGIIGTGEIACEFAAALARSRDCDVVNVVGSTPAKAQAFASRFELPSYCSSLTRMLAEDGVEAVYVASPNSLHEQHAIQSLQAGKHVLCEKPMGTDAASVERIIAAAQSSGGFLMEAFMYRCHPVIPQLLEALSSGAIGAIRHVRANFGFRGTRAPESRLFRPELGGGAILDLGCYTMSLARLLAGLSAGRPFLEPTRVLAVGEIGPTGVDERASCLLQFSSGFSAELACSITQPFGTSVEIFGDSGVITLPNVWLAEGQRQGLKNSFIVQPPGAAPKTVTVAAEQSVFALEAESVHASLSNKEPRWPLLSLEDSLGNARALDRWRAELDVK
jgi:predicted dehydrogenase